MLGPKLWNVFFNDVDIVISACDFTAMKFADDLTSFKLFDRDQSDDAIFDALKGCQEAVHGWGASNRVSFDKEKEEFCILHHISGSGADFRLLGPVIDSKLTMHSAVYKVASKARPKLYALLRTRRFYSNVDLILQFKVHILPILESVIGAIYHATPIILAQIDRIKEHFLKEIDLSFATAFLKFNFAPLQLRRDIAMLGVLHKCTLGIAHPSLAYMFPAASPTQTQTRYYTRLGSRRHNKQILDRCQSDQLEFFRRSLFGLVGVYNLLP